MSAQLIETVLERHVWFVDEFLTEAELSTLLSRADLCVTPYLSDEQASSGALTFALAAGCPVVSTDTRTQRNR